jgi:aminoglycoside phosphotransferase family enzyme/predicted kinase
MNTLELSVEQQAGMVRALHTAAGAAAQLIETHISYVLLDGERAYKFKKALKTPYLDQSTWALRRHACLEEVRLNRRLAPALYLGVLPVGGTLAAPVLGGAGTAIDHAVQMQAFAQSGLWDRLAQRSALLPSHIDALVGLLVPFHAAAATAAPAGWLGSPAQVRAPLLQSLDELSPLLPTPAGRAGLQRLRAWEAQAFGQLEALMARRLAQGRVRECHGDLHLGNVAQIDGRTTVFDCIEFNDEFRFIDVVSELAFMAMDLHAHGLPALAHRLVDGYLQASGDHAGLRLLDYHLVHRALVRAKVALLRARQGGSGAADAGAVGQRYLALAQDFLSPPGAVLLVTHGFSGSGKSTLTQGLLEALGAVRVRADVERKRMAGLQPQERSGSPPGSGLYSAAMHAATYDRLRELAAVVLQAGRPVILDATFLSRAQRDATRQLALTLQVPWVILDFDAEPAELRRRLRERQARGGDASEADAAVLAAQMQSADPLQADEMDAVFCCQAATGADAGPGQVDWAPLLARLKPPLP